MLKFGLLILLINLFLKLILGIGLWKMAMNHKSGNTVEEGMQENQDNNDMLSQNHKEIISRKLGLPFSLIDLILDNCSIINLYSFK